MLKMVIVPDWVRRAVEASGAPFETVLDAGVLSSILSPRDVAFYLASVEAARLSILQDQSPTVPSYAPLLRALPDLHINHLDWLKDALENSEICPETHERLLLILGHFKDITAEMSKPTVTEDTLGGNETAAINDRRREYINRLTATLWRDPTLALSGNAPEEEMRGLPSYVPEVRFAPIVIKDPNTLKCTGLDKDHLNSTQPAARVVVLAALFSPADTHESPMKVYERSYGSALQAVSQFMPLHAALATPLLSGYINAHYSDKRAS